MRWKHGQVHPETGLVFVGYYKSCKNGEWWMERARFDDRLKKRADAQKRRYATNDALRQRLLNKNKQWQKTERAKEYDSARKSRPEELAKRRERAKKRRQQSPVYVAAIRVRQKLSKVLKAKRMERSQTAAKSIGLDWRLFEKFIGDQFASGMSWGNIGSWHIDHFIPMKAATTERQVETLSHYTNLRPLWAKDNLAKGDRFPSWREISERNAFIDAWNKNNLAPAQMGGMQTQGLNA